MAGITDEDLVNRFTYHPPRTGQLDRFARIRSAVLETARIIVANTPPGREQSLAITSLESSVMWANAGIARNADAPYPVHGE